jgi:uncharacterized membrane protein YdjX (TVP38/TMEM64 family)
MSEPLQEPLEPAAPTEAPYRVADPADLVEEKLAVPPKTPAAIYRLVGLVVVLLLLVVLAYAFGITEYLDTDRIRALVEPAGNWGFVMFVGLFAAGTTAHVPSWAFIGVATLLWGVVVGALVSYVSALITISVAFFVVRQVGGQALSAVERPWMKKVLGRLADRPILTVALLRMPPLFLTPAVSYALALTPIRYRDFLIGSALGILPGVIFIATGASALFGW